MTHRYSGLKALTLGLGLVVLSALAVHFIYAVWPWPHAPRGAVPLREAVIAERAWVEQIADAKSIKLIGAAIAWTYRIAFEWTGLDSFMHSAMDFPNEESNEDIARRMAAGTLDLMAVFYWSVQLIGLRLGVLFVSLPLMLIAAVGGAVDGGATWYLRRTRVGRETGTLYHRAKFGLWIALFSLWGLYLIPPVALDPKRVIPPFIIIFMLTVRFSVSWFKKYI